MAQMIKGKLKKWGNSFGVVIPKEIVDSQKLKENEEVEILIIKKNRNILKESFGILKFKKTTDQMMREMDRELYPDDYK